MGLGHFGTTGDPNRQGFDLFMASTARYMLTIIIQNFSGVITRKKHCPGMTEHYMAIHIPKINLWKMGSPLFANIKTSHSFSTCLSQFRIWQSRRLKKCWPNIAGKFGRRI